MCHHPLRPYLLWPVLLFWTVCCRSQTTPAYESISIAQGLSQGMVFDILQDKEGFIWVATKNGLNRYDGYEFKIFSNDPNNPHSLSSNTIIKLYEDSRGHIWAGTENAGVNIYDKKTGKFYRIAHSTSDLSSLSGNASRYLEELPDGRMLVSADEAGLNIVQLTEDFFRKNSPPVVTRLALPDNAQVYGLGKDKNGTVWIGALDGAVYRFDPARNNFIRVGGAQLLNNGYYATDGSIMISGQLLLLNGNEITPLFDIDRIKPGNIIFRPREKLWINHHREVYFYDVAKWEAGKSVQWNLQLPDTRIIYPFIIDKSGILWTGTVGYGLRKYNATAAKFKPLLPAYSVRWIVPVSANNILIGDYGYGWRRLIDDSAQPKPFSKIPSVTQIDNILVTRTGDYWLKSDDKGYFKYQPSSGKLTPVPAINYFYGEGDKQPILEDSKGNIWFSGLGGRFIILHTSSLIDSFCISTNAAKPIPSKAICTALYEDKSGTFWIGTQEGFAKVTLNDTNNSPRINWYYNANNGQNSLNYNSVSCFLDDPNAPDRYLWICTKGGGLNRLDKRTDQFIHVTSKEGLPDDVVYGIVADNDGNIWGSTNRGLFCLIDKNTNDPTGWVFRNFTKAYGLQDDEFNTGAYAKLPDGRLAFGGVNGLNIFDPKQILSAEFKPGVFITNMLVNNSVVTAGDNTGVLRQTIEATESITLNHLQDILTLEFSALDFTAPAQNKYRYRLQGADKAWIEAGPRRTATYLHLPAGNYVFQVQGTNSQGIWSDKITELNITVLPPWWKTWWAYSLYVLVSVLAVVLYFRFSVNRAKLKSQLLFEQKEAKRAKELDTIKTQLYTNITHEFRTPLTVILGMAHQVAAKPEEHLKSGTDMIIRNGEHLLNLVNEMLDLSKLDSGKMTLQYVEGDIINFLRYIVESFHSFAESQNKQLHFLSDIDFLPINYDPEKMRQIIANLLSNAVKFTPEKGNIYLSVTEISTAEENEATLVIKVKDTGIGIPEDQIQFVFDRFYQTDRSNTRRAEGTGIGLALTKELVKLMKGDITVKSPPAGANKGTEFTVTLPVKRLAFDVSIEDNNGLNMEPPSPTIGNIVKSKITEDWQKMNNLPLILLVEDNADVVAYTASCLPDYRLAVAKDGSEGLQIATNVIPDLVITDVMMPVMDGFELCKALRDDVRTSHIPVIMLTAKVDKASKVEGLSRGADVYVEKPFNREELLLQIKKLLQLRKTLQEYYLRQAGIKEKSSFNQSPPEEKTEDAFVKKVRQAVEAHLSDIDFTVEQLCKYVFMSHSQLHRKLEALTGCNPTKFIRIIRLNKAKELLSNSDSPIISIALDCGYNDPAYFSRVFKQENGVTPQEWRSRYKQGIVNN